MKPVVESVGYEYVRHVEKDEWIDFIFSHTAVLLKQPAAIKLAQLCDNSVCKVLSVQRNPSCTCAN